MTEDHGDPIVLILDAPPGVNKLYRPVRTKTGARMIKSDVGRRWADYAVYQIRLQRGDAMIPYKFHAIITLPKKRADADAFTKEIFDACQAGGAIVNDAYNEGYTVQIDPDRPKGSVRIDLMPTGEKVTDRAKKVLKKLQRQTSLFGQTEGEKE